MPIAWPERYQPGRVNARVSNEISIDAPPERVWSWLVGASGWPDWYANASDIRIAGGAGALTSGARFTWRTFGVQVRSTIREFEPPGRIAWDGRAVLLDVYHAWLIEARPGGCHVLTEEHQNGLAAVAQKLLMPNRMHDGHQLWLESLKTKAESGPPPAV